MIAIIGILSSVVLASLNSAREKARDARRIADLREMQKAVELYYDDNGSYPSTGGSSNYRGGASGCYGGYGYGSAGFIPGLVPDYMPSLPADPRPIDNPGTSSDGCYLYSSDGVDYTIIVHQTIETFDPDNGPHPLDRPCCNQQSLSVYSPGARTW